MATLSEGRARSKKSVRIGEASSLTFEEYAGMAVDTQAELIRAQVPLGLLEIGRQLDVSPVTYDA